MQVLVGSFTAESNTFAPFACKLSGFNIVTGDAMIGTMHAADLFEQAGIPLIPSIFADGGSHGPIQKEAFDHIASAMIRAVERHIHEIDGIFLFLHGASYVQDLEITSGEHYILREIRRLVGPDVPIAVVMDPHGNVSRELAENATIIRCYRHSPHTDIAETYRYVAFLLIELLEHPRRIRPVYARVPILLGGERCASLDEPLSLINQKLDELEQSEHILSASYHVGFAWADSPLCCAGVIVVPASESSLAYAREAANEIAEFVWSKRRQFHFTGNAMECEQAIDAALSYEDGVVVVSDSGDNTTAGSLGYNTVFLRQFLATAASGAKHVLFCAIHDPLALKALWNHENGSEVSFELGANIDGHSAPISLTGRVVAKRQVYLDWGGIKNPTFVAVISVGTIDIAVADSPVPFVRTRQFEELGLDPRSYDVIVVKQGYLFPELGALTSYPILAFTPGATDQKTERLPYQTIVRPMYPIDT